ncbi:MAG: RHS repeat-associated core domain-containing protein, partial [Proteobacteria bacterium]|nr:RHS repeat-associated core domain-containing protein [Pseudomonadota bacterium]
SVSGSLVRTLGYDAAGNVLTYSDITHTYNNRGRLKSTKKGTATRSYVYNALGQRVKASGGTGVATLFAYDEAGHLLGEYNSTGGLIQETVWLGDIPVATLRPGTPIGIFYVHTDHLNTPRRVTRPSDNKKRWEWNPDPFGTTLANENPQSLGAFKYNLRFPGQLYEAHSGLHYNYFRDYDPGIGRYVESDPIGLRGGLNTYLYARANALRYSDPRGLDAWIGGSTGGRIDMFIGGYGARTGHLANVKTGEHCTVSYRCMNVGVGVLAAVGSEASGSLRGPKCGRDLGPVDVSVTFDFIAPTAGGFNFSVDFFGSGVGVGVGPDAGVGAFVGGSICSVRVLQCSNTPCECRK